MKTISPLFNYPDGVWNFGESTDGADVGGVLGADPLVSPPAHVPLLSGGWATHPRRADMIHYIGSFRRPAGAAPGDETQASFQLVGPASLSDGQKIVVVLFTPPTFGPPEQFDKFAPHDYPGDPAYFGLIAPNGNGAHVDIVERHQAMAAQPPYRVVGVQFTPRTAGRPIAFTMQRLRQVRKVAEQLVVARYGITAPHEGKIAYLVTGGSFGGFTSVLATVYYPQEFHAAASSAYSAAHRSMPSDFDGHMFAASLLGLGASLGYTMRDALEIPLWSTQEQTDYLSASFTNRWLAGHVQRPVHFLIGDEDAVTHGTDWVQVLAGGANQDQVLTEYGRRTRSDPQSRTVSVHWSVAAKTCHGGDRPGVFTLDIDPFPVEHTTDALRPLEMMVFKAHQELSRGQVLPVSAALIGRKISSTHLPTPPSLDPSRAALAHSGNRATANFYRGTSSSLLTENTAFARYGQGTWLGAADSLKVRTLPGDDRASVFVGSADGYVTRLKMETRAAGAISVQPLVEQKRSSRSGVPYALGHGTFGLDVGEIDGNSPGLEVAVASYNRVALFQADTMDLIREVTLPNWEYDQPRKLQIADLLDDDGAELVMRTYHGHLLIMDKSLTVRYKHEEGGIVDLVVGPQPARQSGWLKRPIYLLSARGHVVRLEIDASRPYPAYPTSGLLAGASPLQYGGLRDLDLVTFSGQTHLAGLFAPQLGDDDAVRFFHVDDCRQVGTFGNIAQPPRPPEEGYLPSVLHASLSGDASFCFVAGHGGDRYAIWSGEDVSIWDGYDVIGHKRLATFSPAAGHAALQSGNIDPVGAGDELVVATVSGKVVWFSVNDLLGANTTLALTRRSITDPIDGRTYEDRCNTSLSATWAIAAEPAVGSTPGRLRCIDSVGTWYDVDPVTGHPTRVAPDLGYSARSLATAATSGVALGSGGTAHRTWEVNATYGPTALFTAPYVPDQSENPPTPWFLPQGLRRPWIELRAGYWVLQLGGASYFDGVGVRLAWWQKADQFFDLVQHATYLPAVTSSSSIAAVWGSTQGVYGAFQPPPRWPTGPTGFKPLRTELGSVVPMNLQGVRIGRVLPGQSEPQVVVSAMGGRVMVLNGSDGTLLTESADYGLGGMALGVGDLDGNPANDEIVFAPVYSPMPSAGQTVRSYLHVLKGSGTSLIELPVSTVPVGDTGTDDFVGYGACGIAIADVAPHGKLVIVGTLNGEIAVFKPLPNGALDPTPVFRTVVEGAVGAFNSIVVANLVPDTEAKPELYIGGSSGLRRFDFQ